MKPFLLLAGLVLVAGLAVWFARSGSSPAPGALAPASAAESSKPANSASALESEAAGRKSAADPAAKPPTELEKARAAQTPAAPQPIDPSVIASGLDGGMPSDASAAADTSAFEAKYAGATKAELKASYDAMRVLYDENREGRVEDKERQLTPEALADLAREIAWLKDKAFGGG